MDNKNGNEMERIQRGLEAFLEKELDSMEGPGNGGQGYHTDAQSGQGRGQRKALPEEIRIIGEETYETRRQSGDWEGEDSSEAFWGRQEAYFESESGAVKQRDGGQVDRETAYDDEEDFCDWDGEPPRQQRTYSHRGKYDRDREERYERRAPDREERYERRERDRGERYERGEWDREEKSGRRRADRGAASGKRASDRAGESRKEDPQMAEKSQKSQKSRKKKRKKKHRLLKFLITAAVIVALLGAGLYQLVGVVYGKMSYREIASVTGAPMQEEGVINVLLIGNDSRENGEDGRSDAMILLSISRKTKTIYMTSLLRDMYVEIPGHEGNRLNAAYSFGGAELLMETIEKNFDISVNRYILVNFEAFAGLVDAVGGIELELTSEEIEYVNGYLVEYNMLTDRPQGTDNMDTSLSGLVHLNGPQALAYSRNRYLGTDFGRTDRQRKVLTAVIKKLPSALLTNAGGLLEGLMPNLTTNLTQSECFRLSLMAGRMLTYDIVSDSIPQPGTYRDVTIRKMSVLEVDFQANIKYLKEKLYGESPAR